MKNFNVKKFRFIVVENGNLFLIKTEEGFVVDVYNQDENVNTMTVWEDDLTPNEE
jgi:hypothetical protein